MEDILHDKVDRFDFLKTLTEACHKTGFQVLVWRLMRNHFHLGLETPNANLLGGMCWLLSTYTLRRKLVGHLFTRRYKALLVKEAQTAISAPPATRANRPPGRHPTTHAAETTTHSNQNQYPYTPAI